MRRRSCQSRCAVVSPDVRISSLDVRCRSAVAAMLAAAVALAIAGCGGEPPRRAISAADDTPVASRHKSVERPVHRFADTVTGGYLLTADEAERVEILAKHPHFRSEGVAFGAAAGADARPVWRFANLRGAGYFYTASPEEREDVLARFPHLRPEGSSFAAAAPGTPGSAPVYRLANLVNGAYLYTQWPGERSGAIASGIWRDEGIAFWAPAPEDVAAPPPERVVAKTIADRLQNPWGLAFLPDGRALVTEKQGRLRIVSLDGGVSPALAGMPAVMFQGQGGLLDVVLGPDFASDRRIYFTFSEPVAGVGSRTAVGRAVFGETSVTEVEIIHRQTPALASQSQFGARLVFGRDGTLFATLGDRNERDLVQRLDNTIGKVVRIRPDGSVPSDNPFVGVPGVRPEIWSWGHRTPQGAALEPGTGRFWLHEHGPLGGDELNVVERGRDYGWPRITYGREYVTGETIGEGTTAPDVEAPVHHWLPLSIGPSGLAFYDADRVPGWRSSLFIGALATRDLRRLTLDGGRVVAEERLLTAEGERIRDVRQGPDGALYVLTDAPNGRLLRVEPATR